MNTTQSPAQKIVPKVTRRDFIAQTGGLALSTLPGMEEPTKPMRRPGLIHRTVALAVQGEDKVTEAFFLQRKYRSLASWIVSLDETRKEVPLARWEGTLRSYGLALANRPPSPDVISEFINSPIFERSRTGRAFLAGRTSVEAIAELQRVIKFTPAQLDSYITEALKPKPAPTQDLPKTEEAPQEALSQPQEEMTLRRRNFADMAAARKAGGYPVPANSSERQLIETAIGQHSTSGESRERASQTARICSGPSR